MNQIKDKFFELFEQEQHDRNTSKQYKELNKLVLKLDKLKANSQKRQQGSSLSLIVVGLAALVVGIFSMLPLMGGAGLAFWGILGASVFTLYSFRLIKSNPIKEASTYITKMQRYLTTKLKLQVKHSTDTELLKSTAADLGKDRVILGVSGMLGKKLGVNPIVFRLILLGLLFSTFGWIIPLYILSFFILKSSDKNR